MSLRIRIRIVWDSDCDWDGDDHCDDDNRQLVTQTPMN